MAVLRAWPCNYMTARGHRSRISSFHDTNLTHVQHLESMNMLLVVVWIDHLWYSYAYNCKYLLAARLLQ